MDTKVNDTIDVVRRLYEAPELVELGDAAPLTLGNVGCQPDTKICAMYPSPSPF